MVWVNSIKFLRKLSDKKVLIKLTYDKYYDKDKYEI